MEIKLIKPHPFLEYLKETIKTHIRLPNINLND